MESEENTVETPPEPLQELLQEIGNRTGATISRAVEDKINASSGLSGVNALVARHNQILDTLEARLAERKSRQGAWSGVHSDDHVPALERELAAAREEALAGRTELEAIQGRALSLENENQAFSARLQEIQEEKDALQSASAQRENAANAEIARLGAMTSALEQQIATANAQVQELRAQDDAQDIAQGIESKEVEAEIATLRKNQVALEREMEQVRADAAHAATASLEGSRAKEDEMARQVASLEARIHTLEQEKRVLELALAKARQEEPALREMLANREQDVIALQERLDACLQAMSEGESTQQQPQEHMSATDAKSGLRMEGLPEQSAQEAGKGSGSARAEGRFFRALWSVAGVLAVLVLLQGYMLSRQWSARPTNGQLAASPQKVDDRAAPAQPIAKEPGEATESFPQRFLLELEAIKQELSALNVHVAAALPRGEATASGQADAIRDTARVLTPAASLVTPGGEPGAPVKAVIPFLQGNALVVDADAQRIQEVATRILAAEAHSVLVLGYTDSTPLRGDLLARYEDNVALSKARAQSVGQQLVKSGINPRSIFAQGLGSAMPLAGNDTPENRAMNRRVEIIAW